MDNDKTYEEKMERRNNLKVMLAWAMVPIALLIIAYTFIGMVTSRMMNMSINNNNSEVKLPGIGFALRVLTESEILG